MSATQGRGRSSHLGRRPDSNDRTRSSDQVGGVLDLALEWRARAGQLKEYGAATQALVLERCAEELEHSVGEWQNEPLNLTEAAEVSGYSADHLGRLIREGKIPNRGRPGAPKIARGDLPMKQRPLPETVAPSSGPREISRTAIVQSIIDRGVA